MPLESRPEAAEKNCDSNSESESGTARRPAAVLAEQSDRPRSEFEYEGDVPDATEQDYEIVDED